MTVSYHTRWVRALRRENVKRFGGRCANPRCEDPRKALQFAHVHGSANHLRGMSRGSQLRVLDVRRYPHDYILLCYECHRRYDCEGSL